MANDMKLLVDGPRRAKMALVLAHGAGASMDTDFMNAFAQGLAGQGVRVVRFEFPYMVRRRQTNKRRPPDREPVLRDTWFQVLDMLDAKKMVVGGKSMGGRIASLIADEAKAKGLVCLGYPFHPSGKSDKLRVEHLKSLATPTLIVQGERDLFGNIHEVAGYELSENVQVHWVSDGDHSFKPRKASGISLQQNMDDAIKATVDFVSGL